MKTFLEFITESKKPKKKKAPKKHVTYRGTSVYVAQGNHSKKESGVYKGTAVVSNHGNRKKLEERFNRPPKVKKYRDWVKEHENNHLGENHDQVGEHLHQAHPFDEAPHTPEVDEYTSASHSLNKSLLGHYQSGQVHPDKIFEHNLPKLDKAIDHHSLKHELHVYSGVSFHPGIEAAKNPEGKLHLPAYTSTSLSKAKAHEFTAPREGKNHVLHVHLKPSQKGIYVGKFSAHGDNEHEFLLPRHTTLKVHPKPTIVHGPEGETHIWHSHVVPNEKA